MMPNKENSVETQEKLTPVVFYRGFEREGYVIPAMRGDPLNKKIINLYLSRFEKDKENIDVT